VLLCSYCRTREAAAAAVATPNKFYIRKTAAVALAARCSPSSIIIKGADDPDDGPHPPVPLGFF